MYIILKNPDDNPITYHGAICIMELVPWYVTGMAKPTLFPTEKAAEGVIKKLAKSYPKDEFTVIPLELYLGMIDGSDHNNKWFKEVSQELQK